MVEERWAHPVSVEEAAQGAGNGIADEGELPEENGLLGEDAHHMDEDVDELDGTPVSTHHHKTYARRDKPVAYPTDTVVNLLFL